MDSIPLYIRENIGFIPLILFCGIIYAWVMSKRAASPEWIEERLTKIETQDIRELVREGIFARYAAGETVMRSDVDDAIYAAQVEAIAR
jgi:hypothetical protein